jgi:hypothetical protein
MVALELGVIAMKKHQRVLQFRKWFILAAIVSVACGLLSTTARIVKSYLEGARPFQPTYFTDFFACGGVDPITGEPLPARDIFSSSEEAIYVCGHLKANGVAQLGFLLKYESESPGWFITSDPYRSGFVIEEIPRHQRQPGRYRVEVWMSRSKLASTEFTIVP